MFILNGEKITAIDMFLSTTDCDEPCNAITTVTWKNIGNGPGKFRPGITINGTRVRLEETTLNKNQTITKTFNLNGLMEGIYRICPDPN
jgi:hypothetical protein